MLKACLALTCIVLFLIPTINSTHSMSLAGAPAVSFVAGQTIIVGSLPNMVVAGDLNRDGKADLAVTNGADNTVSVALGNGEGTFGSVATYPPTGKDPIGITLADVNNDGNPDLVVAMTNSDVVRVLLGKTDGTFGPGSYHFMGSVPYAVAAADFNGDHEMDVAATNIDYNTITVHLDIGYSHPISETFATGHYPIALATGTLRGNGKIDLAVANYYDNSVGVLLGNGDGTFQRMVTYAVGNNPSALTVGDFNGDGKQDLAVTNYADNTVGILFGNGDGTFQPAVTVPVGSGPIAIATADFNVDGNQDLAVANYNDNTVTVLQGNGDGTFQPAITVPVGLNPISVAAADFNGDGRPDLAVANQSSNTVSVLINTSGVVVTPTSTPAGTATSTVTATPTITATPTTLTGSCPTGWACRDIGTPSPPGGQSVSSGTFTIQGGGVDIWNTVDNFYYVSQPLVGDGSISAHVTSQSNTNPWAKAGVMLRQTTDPGSPFYAAFITPSNGVAIDYRATAGANAIQIAAQPGTVPIYLEVVRAAGTYSAYTSSDGVTWTAVPGSPVALTLNSTLLAGLAITSHQVGSLSTAVFDTVAVAAAPSTQTPTVTLTAVPPSNTGTPTSTATATLSASATTDPSSYTVTPTGTAMPSSTATITAMPSSTASATPSASATTAPSSYTVTPSATAPPSSTAIVTATPSPTASATPSVTASTTTTVTLQPTATATISPTSTASVLPTATATPACPNTWNCADIGVPAPAGSQTLSNGIWTVQGGGADIWGTADQFHFVWQTLNGDGNLSADVSAQSNSNTWAKAGVMFRQTTDPGSPFYAALVTPGNGIAVEYRTAQGGVAAKVALAGTVPTYLRVARAGNTFSAYTSSDGVTWTLVPSSSMTISMSSTLLTGLAVTSHLVGTLSTVSFAGERLSNVAPPTITPTATATPACPNTWTCADIGVPAPAGSQTLSNGIWTVQGGGADIWGTADQFHFVWQTLNGDGNLSADVSAQSNSNTWAKAGVMFRQTTDPGSPFYAALVTPGNGIAVEYRTAQGGVAAKVALAGTVPTYLRVARAGNTFSAYTSSDGVTWTLVPSSSMTISMSSTLLTGLAVTSHLVGTLSTVSFAAVGS